MPIKEEAAKISECFYSNLKAFVDFEQKDDKCFLNTYKVYDKRMPLVRGPHFYTKFIHISSV